MIDSICHAMSLYQDEEAIYSDINADAYNELIENQFSNICKIMDGCMALKNFSGGIQNCPPAVPNLNTVFAGPS